MASANKNDKLLLITKQIT